MYIIIGIYNMYIQNNISYTKSVKYYAPTDYRYIKYVPEKSIKCYTYLFLKMFYDIMDF